MGGGRMILCESVQALVRRHEERRVWQALMTSLTLSDEVTLSSAPASIVNRVFSRTSSRRRIGRQTRRTIRVPTPFRSPSACALPTRRAIPSAAPVSSSSRGARKSASVVAHVPDRRCRRRSTALALHPTRCREGFESDPALRSSRGCVAWPSWLVARQPRRSYGGFPAQRGRDRGRTLLRAQAARYSPELGTPSAMPSNPPMQPTHLRQLHQRPRHLRFTVSLSGDHPVAQAGGRSAGRSASRG